MKLWSLEEAMAEIAAQRKRERWYKPGTWMFYAARRRVGDSRREVKYAWQRVFRGWDDRAAWNTGDWLAETLGELLVNMADIAHGFPPFYPEHEGVYGDTQYLPDEPRRSAAYTRWVGDLRAHGEALLTWQREHHDIHDPEAYEAIHRPAQAALRWTAEYLTTLWD